MGSQAKFILPFTPGSASGILARTVGDKLGGALDQSVVVANRLGAAMPGTAKRKVRCPVC